MRKRIALSFFLIVLLIVQAVPVFAAKTGWSKENGKTYYYQNGKKVKNQLKTINGVEYKFDKNGVKSTSHYVMMTPYINQSLG